MWSIKNHDWSRTTIRLAFLLALVGGVPLTASALAPSKGYNAAVVPDGRNFKIKFASDGTPTAAMTNTPSGVAVNAPAPIKLSPTNIITTVAVGAIGGASVGGAVGAAVGAIGALGVATLPGFVELFDRAKHRVKPDGSFEAQDPTVCTVAPCTEYAYRTGPNGSTSATGYYSTAVAACQQSLSITQAANPGITFTFVSAVAGSCNYKTSAGGSQVFTYPGVTRAADPLPAAYLPSNLDAALAAITANAPTAAEVQALVDANFPPEVTTPAVTGPARVFNGNTIEMFSPNEKRTIEEWKNLDYSTPGEVKVQTEKKTTITSDAKTSTTVTVNQDGTTSTATTTTPAATKVETTTDDDEKEKDDPCRMFPARVGCLDIDVPGGEIPRSTKTITFQEENVFGSGSCPANMTATIATLGKTVTVWDWSKTCEKSLPLRALVLLLSSFAAFLIVMPGSTRT